jgi:hypothetical protein
MEFPRADHKRKRGNDEADAASVQVETNSQGSQPRKTSVKASRFANVLRQVYSLGFLELPCGPWCYGQRVKISESNTVDTDRAGLEGRVLWPDDGILQDWARSVCASEWMCHPGWSPANAVAVRWSDGHVDYHKAGFVAGFGFDRHDLQIVVSYPQGSQGDVDWWRLHTGGLAWNYRDSAQKQTAYEVAGRIPDVALRGAERERLLGRAFTAEQAWLQRIRRSRSYFLEAYLMEMYRILPPDLRYANKRRFTDFMEYFNTAFTLSHIDAPVWWEVKKLLG